MPARHVAGQLAATPGRQLRADSVNNALRTRLGSLPTADSGLMNGVAAWASPALDESSWSDVGTAAAASGSCEATRGWMGSHGTEPASRYRERGDGSSTKRLCGSAPSTTTRSPGSTGSRWRTNGSSVPRLYDVASALKPGRKTC